MASGKSHTSVNGVYGVPLTNGFHHDTSDVHNGPTEDNDISTASLDGIAKARLEPIAVVGFSIKFPQDATSHESFWKMLMEKRCSMTEWPQDRLNLDAFYHPDSSRPDTVLYDLMLIQSSYC